MASAIDSGVDTGYDSNDSCSVQEKNITMDLENSTQSSGSGKENKPHEEREESSLIPSPSQISMNDPVAGISFSHLQPVSLSHGYECNPPLPPPPTDGRSMKMGCVALNLMSSLELGGEGKRYEAAKLVMKMGHRYHSNMVQLRKCLRSATCPANYVRVRDSVRMCRAACHNNTEAMRQMLSSGLSPNVYDGYKRTPLHLAACMGYTDMVKLLLDHGADPNAKDSIGNTPLHLAACTNHVSVVTLLLRAGTRVSERDLAGHSPLHLAVTKFNIMKRSLVPHPVLKDQVCQVITMLTEYMRRKEGATIDPELLNKFESMVRVSDSSEEVETNIRDLLDNLSSLSLDPS